MSANLTVLKSINNTFKDVELQMFANTAARSISYALVNRTNETIYWVDSYLHRGERVETAPDEIPPGYMGRWLIQSESNKTGVEARIDWRIGEDGPEFRLSSDNPFIGDNEYRDNLDDSRYKIERLGGGGNDAKVRWILTNA